MTLRKWIMLLKNYDQHNCFKSGQETLDDRPRSRRTATSVSAETVSEFNELVHASQQITKSELVNEGGISCGSAQTILTELQTRWDDTTRAFFSGGGHRVTRTPKHFVNLTGESKNFKCWNSR